LIERTVGLAVALRTIAQIESRRGELVAWRHDLHSHPELAYEERRTAAFVAAELRSYGLEVHEGLARTGVVGTLSAGPGPKVALRADMDGLPIQEANDFAYRSRHAGKMHACGHDGHTVMLLGAARHLAEHGAFRGTVQFVFQPAEEAAGGARVMIEEGLFERFPVDAVFGMHNWPGVPVGRFATRTGPLMASLDTFDIRIDGKGTHGALPHHGVDPVVAAAEIVGMLQTVVSRNVDPLRAAVVSVTKIHGGDAHNVIPETVTLGGGIRCFEPEVRDELKRRLSLVATNTAAALGARAAVEFGEAWPAVVNSVAETALAEQAAASVVGAEGVDAAASPVLGSEDFAYMLERRPGCYVFIGNGDAPGSCMIHNPAYDFNDEILTVGASYWVRLTETFLARS
jgi:amidohydrolase